MWNKRGNWMPTWAGCFSYNLGIFQDCLLYMNVHSSKFEERETEREGEREGEREHICPCEAEASEGTWPLCWSPEALTSGARAVSGVFVIVYFKTFSDASWSCPDVVEFFFNPSIHIGPSWCVFSSPCTQQFHLPENKHTLRATRLHS